jgi:hypothetical protein
MGIWNSPGARPSQEEAAGLMAESFRAGIGAEHLSYAGGCASNT